MSYQVLSLGKALFQRCVLSRGLHQQIQKEKFQVQLRRPIGRSQGPAQCEEQLMIWKQLQDQQGQAALECLHLGSDDIQPKPTSISLPEDAFSRAFAKLEQRGKL